ncbi:DedA family protein [bacterium]|nr:DedA family protein [bacterium]
MEALKDFFFSLNSGWGYGFLFVASLGENLCPPMPGDTVVVLGAFLVGRGQLAWWPAYAVVTAGSITGFMLVFMAGERWGRRLVELHGGRLFSPDHLDQVHAWFDRWGYGLIAANRFFSGFRAVVSLAAGIAQMDRKKVFLLALLSCLLWNALLMILGLWLGEYWEIILGHYQKIAAGVVSVVLLVFIIKYFRNKRGE